MSLSKVLNMFGNEGNRKQNMHLCHQDLLKQGSLTRFEDLPMGTFTMFVSHEYAMELTRNYDKVYSFYNWMVLTIPMPILVLILYYISREIHINKTKHLEPSAPAGAAPGRVRYLKNKEH